MGEPSAAAAAVLAAIEAARDASTVGEAELAAYEARKAREAREDRLRKSGVVLRKGDADAVLDEQLVATRALTTVKNWVAASVRKPDPGPSVLVLCGPMGVGKNVAAAWAHAREGGRYVTLEQHVRDWERWMRDRSWSDEAARELERCYRGRLFTLDELGTETEREQESVRRSLHRVVEKRLERSGQLTLILTNLREADVRERFAREVYDPRTLSRLARDGRIVAVDGRDMRAPTLAAVKAR
jgi:DNA replication protein DnaC